MSADQRPVNLDLTKFSFPLPALTSITHRITGVVLFAGIAVLLFILDSALASEAGYAHALELLARPGVKLIVWAVLAALSFHVVAGLKHLVMDMGVGETLEGAKAGAWFTIIGSAILFVLAGLWVW